MSEEEEGRRGSERRERGREWNGKQGAKVRGKGGLEGEVIPRNSSPGRDGVESDHPKTFPRYLYPLLHLSKKVCVCV